MANLSADFVTNFHSLTGETIPERRKNYRLLLNKTKKALANTSEDINLSILHPKNSIEEILKVEAIIYFRKVPELMKILKNENPIHIAKVLKVSPIFLAEAFGDVKGDELVKEIFPLLSFNTKLKLLYKLVLHLENTQQAEEFFEAIRKNYSLYMASKLLPGCSEDFILKTIKANRIEVTSGQLMIIIKKYPKITEPILEALNHPNNKLTIAEKYKPIFVHLLQNNAKLFLKLHEKYNPILCIGHRMTKKFILENKECAVNNSQKIYKLFKDQQVFPSLNDDFKQFFVNIFPKTLNQYEKDYTNLLGILQHAPKDFQKGKLLLETFKKTFGNDLWDFPKLLTENLIEILSVDERETWMQTHSKPNEISEEDWISYMRTEKSLPLLKQKLSFTSNIKTRAKLVVFLVKTCKINKDKVALADTCKYIMEKHQNDHYTVRQKFLRTLMSDYGLEKLEEDHWIHVNELTQICIFNNENFYEDTVFLKAYIKYRLDNNLPIDEQLQRWVKFNYHRLMYYDPKYDIQCLPLLKNLIGLGRKEEELSYYYVDYLNNLSCWNEKHPKQQISLLPCTKALEYFKSALKTSKESWGTEKILLQLIQTNAVPEEEILTMLNDFFSCENLWMNGDLLKWLLINKPSYIHDNIEIVTKHVLKTGPMQKLPLMWINFQNYSHLDIPQKMSELFIKLIKTQQKDINICDRFNTNELGVAIKGLSHLMNPPDFIKLISAYYPSSLTMEIKSQEEQWKGKIQKSIASSIRNILPPSLALESILKFCKGDYLRFVQKSLYLVCCNVAENNLLSFLNELSTRAVSTRKHSIYLTVKTLNEFQICEMFQRFIEIEKNSSIRKCLFKGAFNFFIGHPDDYSWELFKKIAVLLDINDNEAFKILTKWKRIPQNYLQVYILFTWGMLNKLPDSKDVEEKQTQIFDAITPDIIPVLSKEFCSEIIEQYLFKPKQSENFQAKIQTFASNCIIYSKEQEQEYYLKITFELLKKYVKLSWYDAKSCKIGRKTAFNFITTFCSDFLEKKCLNVEIFQKFIELWNDFLKPCEALSIYLYLQFTFIFLNYSALDDIAEKNFILYESILTQNGTVIVETFENFLKIFLKYFLLNDIEEVAEENRYILIENIMKSTESANRFILAIFLLPEDIPTMNNVKSKYDDVIQALIKEDEPFIQIYLDKYFLKTSEEVKLVEEEK